MRPGQGACSLFKCSVSQSSGMCFVFKIILKTTTWKMNYSRAREEAVQSV